MQKYRLGKQLNRDSHLRENSKDGLGEPQNSFQLLQLTQRAYRCLYQLYLGV